MQTIGMSTAIALSGGVSNASALPILDALSPLVKYGAIAQNGQPPEVIIDGTSGSSSSSTTSTTTTTTTRTGDTRFTCEIVNGEYTVMYYPESQPNRGYPWAIPSQLGDGWSPERRCNEITQRFETYRQDGLLEMSTDVQNNYDIICVTTQVDPTNCRIVLTVPPGQDPQLTRNLIFENLLIADDGQQTQGVYTYGGTQSSTDILNEVGKIVGVDGLGGGSANNQNADGDIDLRPFLDPADGGTGTQLSQGRAIQTQPANNSSGEERKPSLFK
ncbi:MAG: COP23 domain-containing protein [Pleurocapsa sp.]